MWCGSSRGGVMSDSDDDDFKAAAVAAAAFAVNALEEYSNGMITEKKPPSPGPPAASLMEYKATQPLEPDASPPRTSGEASREKSDIISMGGSGAQETANLQRPSPLFDSTSHQIPYLQPPPPPPLPAPLFPKNFSTIGQMNQHLALCNHQKCPRNKQLPQLPASKTVSFLRCNLFHQQFHQVDCKYHLSEKLGELLGPSVYAQC